MLVRSDRDWGDNILGVTFEQKFPETRSRVCETGCEEDSEGRKGGKRT